MDEQISVDGSSFAREAASGVASNASTAETPEKQDIPKSSTKQQFAADPTESNFATLEAFLASAEARKTLSPQLLRAMKEEISSAHVRESLWDDTPSETEWESEDETEAESETESEGACPSDEGESESEDEYSPVLPRSRKFALEPRGSNSWSVRQRASTDNGKWSLWTYVNPALRREEFTCESDARRALQLRMQMGNASPCVLRDPAGRVSAGRSWAISHA